MTEITLQLHVRRQNVYALQRSKLHSAAVFKIYQNFDQCEKFIAWLQTRLTLPRSHKFSLCV